MSYFICKENLFFTFLLVVAELLYEISLVKFARMPECQFWSHHRMFRFGRMPECQFWRIIECLVLIAT